MTSSPSRRTLLRTGIAGLAGLALAPAVKASGTTGPRILTARVATTDPEAWSYTLDGSFPVLRCRQGEELWVRLVNELPEPTSVHWHGIRGPSAMDGAVPLTQAAVSPGGSFDYRFAAKDAGTYWFHAHTGFTGQPRRGLVGALAIEETAPPPVDQDRVLLLAHFGAAREPAAIRINGAKSEDIPVRTNERLRLRFINAAATPIAVRVDGHRPLVVAIDGHPAETFAPRDGLVTLGPGNRVDLIVDCVLAPGAPRAAILAVDASGESRIGELRYDVGPPMREVALVPPRLSVEPTLPAQIPLANAFRIEFAIGEGAAERPVKPAGPAPVRAALRRPLGADGLRDAGPALFSVKRGRTVMAVFHNGGATPAAVHVHGHAFRLLDRLDDGWKPFWLDTMLVPPGPVWPTAFVADNPGKWLLECLWLEAERPATGGWFEVT